MLPSHLPLPAFADRWAMDTLAAARSLLDRTQRAADACGARLLLEAGTLLGHVRHAGRVIPWDDDLDLCVDAAAFERCVDAIRADAGLAVRMVDNPRFGRFAKVVARTSIDASPPAGRRDPWPAIDIFRYAFDGERLLYHPGGSGQFPLERRDVLPARRASFEGVEVWMPARPDRVLDAQFPNWRIEFDSGAWDHRRERPRETRVKVRWNPADRCELRATRVHAAPIAALLHRLGAAGVLQRLGAPRARPARTGGMRVVYTDMCADLFHAGHVNLLRQARALGDRLVVGIHSDATIAGYKDSPVGTMEERVAVVAACRYVDQVVPDAPLEVSPRYLDALGVSIVCHADEIDDRARERMYGEILSTHGLALVPYTPGISSHALRDRVLAASRLQVPTGPGDGTRGQGTPP
jgi:cytidyltransferase-like protein